MAARKVARASGGRSVIACTAASGRRSGWTSAAAARPARRPKAPASSRELDASRLAPCTPVAAHSPMA